MKNNINTARVEQVSASLKAARPSVRAEESALVLIDMQRFFTDPVIENAQGFNWKHDYSRAETAALADRIGPLVEAFRENGVQIVAVKTALDDKRFAHKKAKALGGEDFHGYTPQDGDLLSTKRGTPAFLSGDLDEVLEGRGIKSLFFAGVYAEADMCLGRAAEEAAQRGYDTTVLHDMAVTAEPHNTVADSMKELAEKGVKSASAKEALQDIIPRPTSPASGLRPRKPQP